MARRHRRRRLPGRRFLALVDPKKDMIIASGYNGAQISADEVRAYMRSQLAAYKALADVEFIGRDQVPRNAMGKVVKRELA